MENSKREVFYDEATGQFFTAEDIQKKLTSLLNISGHITLHEMYDMIAESLPEGVRERFLDEVNQPWTNDVGYISFEHPADANRIINFPIIPLFKEEDSP